LLYNLKKKIFFSKIPQTILMGGKWLLMGKKFNQYIEKSQTNGQKRLMHAFTYIVTIFLAPAAEKWEASKSAHTHTHTHIFFFAEENDGERSEHGKKRRFPHSTFKLCCYFRNRAIVVIFYFFFFIKSTKRAS
jgi:hypothetical protein